MAEDRPTRCEGPHSWTAPKIGDDFLLCGVCGRRLNFDELTGYQRRSIVQAIATRESVHVSELFETALAAAISDWKRRTAADQDRELRETFDTLRDAPRRGDPAAGGAGWKPVAGASGCTLLIVFVLMALCAGVS